MTDAPMQNDGVPVYVRQITAPDHTIHRRSYVYEIDLRTTPGGCPIHSNPRAKVICQLTTNVNETQLWCRDDCQIEQEWVALKKAYASMGVAMATVWQHTDIPNLTTGRVETDPKKFATHLREQSEIMGERLGMKVDYQPVDMTDREALGVTDEGMDSTHDIAVKEGRKDSRGRFVW